MFNKISDRFMGSLVSVKIYGSVLQAQGDEPMDERKSDFASLC